MHHTIAGIFKVWKKVEMDPDDREDTKCKTEFWEWNYGSDLKD